MHIHVFCIDLLPVGSFASSGGGMRSLQIIRGLEHRGINVTYSLPKDNDAVRENWDFLSASERENAFSRTEPGRLQFDVLNRISPDAAIYMWPSLFTYPKSNRPGVISVYDANGFQNVESALIQAQPSKPTSLRDATISYLNKLACADLVIAGSAAQRAYWSGVASFNADSYQGLEMVEIPYTPWVAPARKPYEPGEPTFYVTGSFLPWNTPENFLQHTVSVIRSRGKGRVVVVGKANPLLAHSARLNEELRALKEENFATVIDALPYDKFSALINGNGVAVDIHAKTLEREFALPIRSMTFLSHGVPLITNNYSNLSDQVRKHDAGWRLDPEDVDGFKGLVANIIDGKEAVGARTKSKNARDLPKAEFDSGTGFDLLIEKIEARRALSIKRPQRYGAMSFFDRKRALSPVVLICTDDMENFLSLRVAIPFDAMYRAGIIGGYVVFSHGRIVLQLGDSARLAKIDVIWVQRGALSCQQLIHDNFEGKYAYDIDDNLLINPSYRAPFAAAWINGIKGFLSGAACVTATTPRLIASLQNAAGIQIEHKTILAPNLTDVVTPRRFSGPPEALLLAASDVVPLTASRTAFFSAVNKFCTARDMPVLYIGTYANTFKELNCDVISTGFLEYNNYRSFLRNENVVAIAPLDTHADYVTQQFIDCKSDIKLVEMGAAGVPGVFSKAAPYSDSPLEVGPLVDCADTKAILDALDHVCGNTDILARVAGESVAAHRIADTAVVDTWARAVDAARLPNPVDLTTILSLFVQSRSAQSPGYALVSENDFNPGDYIALNPDLQEELGGGNLTAYQHYVTKGFSEGRLWFPATSKEDVLSPASVRTWMFNELAEVGKTEEKIRAGSRSN